MPAFLLEHTSVDDNPSVAKREDKRGKMKLKKEKFNVMSQYIDKRNEKSHKN